jgi:hypothetical protein
MSRPLLLDYQAEHGGQRCRLLVYVNGDAELRRGRAIRKGLVNWVELRDLDHALHACDFNTMRRYYDGLTLGGRSFSLKYKDRDVRVVRCLTRDLWLRFPMLGVLEDMVVRLNGWPSLRPMHDRSRSDESVDADRVLVGEEAVPAVRRARQTRRR